MWLDCFLPLPLLPARTSGMMLEVQQLYCDHKVQRGIGGVHVERYRCLGSWQHMELPFQHRPACLHIPWSSCVKAIPAGLLFHTAGRVSNYHSVCQQDSKESTVVHITV